MNTYLLARKMKTSILAARIKIEHKKVSFVLQMISIQYALTSPSDEMITSWIKETRSVHEAFKRDISKNLVFSPISEHRIKISFLKMKMKMAKTINKMKYL